jgi:competence ComEA-like helix-hairpin-helix protein
MKYKSIGRENTGLYYSDVDLTPEKEKLEKEYARGLALLDELLDPAKAKRKRERAPGPLARWLFVPVPRLLPLCVALSLALLAAASMLTGAAFARALRTPVYVYAGARTPVCQKADVPDFSSGSVLVNQATAKQLTVLPRVGAELAERIIAEREANGPFYFPEDLLSVKGIGQKTLENIRGMISLP